jgi:hypothetical protein
VALLGGLLAGCAAIGLALGTYWVLAPFFVLVVVAIAWFTPRPGAGQVATGALAALLEVLVFGAVTLLLALI